MDFLLTYPRLLCSQLLQQCLNTLKAKQIGSNEVCIIAPCVGLSKILLGATSSPAMEGTSLLSAIQTVAAELQLTNI